MKMSLQDQIITVLEEKMTSLQSVLHETIEKHSDAAYDLKELKLFLEDLSNDKVDDSSEKMLVQANEWEEVK